MKRLKRLTWIILFAVSAALFGAAAARVYAAEPLLQPDTSGTVRIAEYLHSPAARILLMQMNAPLTALYASRPAWQTFEPSKNGENADIRSASIIGLYDIVFTDDERYIKDLESMGLLRQSAPLFAEEIILAGPADQGAGEGSPVHDIMLRIFKENRLFIALMNNEFIKSEELKLWSRAGISSPSMNKNYIESGKDEVSALMQAGDEEA